MEDDGQQEGWVVFGIEGFVMSPLVFVGNLVASRTMWRASVRLLAIVGAVSCAGAVSGQDRFPELRPALKPPAGYGLTFRDGPGFYTWVLFPEKNADRRAGLGMYFGLHPNLQHVDKRTAKRLKGTVCSREVSWWVQTKAEGKSREIRRDAVITYEHGKGFVPIQVHFWVWGANEQEVGALAELLKSLKFEPRAK